MSGHGVGRAIGPHTLLDEHGVDERRRYVSVYVGGSSSRVGGGNLRGLVLGMDVEVGSLHGLHGGQQPRVAAEKVVDLDNSSRQQVRNADHLVLQIGEASPTAVSVHRRIQSQVDAAVGHSHEALQLGHVRVRYYANY